MRQVESLFLFSMYLNDTENEFYFHEINVYQIKLFYCFIHVILQYLADVSQRGLMFCILIVKGGDFLSILLK